jgi:hypothetical protein
MYPHQLNEALKVTSIMLGDLLQYNILLCPNLRQDKKKANIWGKSERMKTNVGQVSFFFKCQI